MSKDFSLPGQGFVFWPVGTGDSVTVAIGKEAHLQIDIRQMESAREDDTSYEPVIDRLVDLLPKRNGKPYLACFVLSHPDMDHCQGFSELLKEVLIGELWFTPRIFREYKKDMCDDAVSFRNEAMRRVKKTIQNKGQATTGDRVRIIGYDDLLKEDDFSGFPRDMLTIPGNAICVVDGVDLSDVFRAFVHSPFKDDADGDRNETSLGLQVTLFDGQSTMKGLFFGDLVYPILRKIFDRSNDDNLAWNVLLAPHHCSKSVMYWKGEGDADEKLRQDILDNFERVQCADGCVVASSEPVPLANKSGDNPPHAKAKSRYQELVNQEFLCTQGESTEDKPGPLVFELADGQIDVSSAAVVSQRTMAAGVLETINRLRGGIKPPTEQVGFGCHD